MTRLSRSNHRADDRHADGKVRKAPSRGNGLLTTEELKRFGEQLGTLRRHLADEIAQLQGLLVGEPSSPMEPDVEWSQRMAIRTVDDKRAILRHVDQALARIADETFGLCVIDSRPIPRDKLAEMPWVKHCEHCAVHPLSETP